MFHEMAVDFNGLKGVTPKNMELFRVAEERDVTNISRTVNVRRHDLHDQRFLSSGIKRRVAR
jgi:hypothetical protein